MIFEITVGLLQISTANPVAATATPIISHNGFAFLEVSIGALGAFAGLAAVVVAIRENRTTRYERVRIERHGLYTRVVLDPLIECLRKFVTDQASALETRCRQVIEEASSEKTHGEVLNACSAAASEFNEAFFELRRVVRIALIAWDDNSLKETVNKAMEAVQDDTLTGLNQLPAVSGDAARASACLSEAIAIVMHKLISYEPQAHANISDTEKI